MYFEKTADYCLAVGGWHISTHGPWFTIYSHTGLDSKGAFVYCQKSKSKG